MSTRFLPIWVVSLLAGAIVVPASSPAQSTPGEPQQRPPKPIEPPHKPAQQGFRLTIPLGFSLAQNSKYTYHTTVAMPDGSVLDYNGADRSSGGTLSLEMAATPGGALRRLTIGLDLNFGGLETWGHSVIPPGSVTPFSQNNLNSQVAQSLASSSWHPSVSPYIEHELGSILQNRIRLGYQYWSSSESYNGSFAVDQSGSIQAKYRVRFSQASHMIRVSLHNDTWLDDTGTDQVPPKRRFGFAQQAGVLIGIDGSVVVFVGVGPAWVF
jgi:hypothetical protein